MSTGSISKYIIVRLGEEIYGFSIDNIVEIIKLSDSILTVPDQPEYIKGMINLRGSVIPVIDLRLKLGYPSLQKEKQVLIDMIEQREQDHINWINTLEKSVLNNTEFTLTTDPHQCAFGKWYYSFKTNNMMLNSFLPEFEKPHYNIHNLGITVKDLLLKNERQAAIDLVSDAKNRELKKMIQLFKELIRLIHNSFKEVALIFEINSQKFAISSDSVANIIQIDSDAIIQPDCVANREFVKGLATCNDQTFVILDEISINSNYALGRAIG